MKKSIYAAAIVLAMSSVAYGADYAPVPMPTELYDWTGFYIGATGGWAFGDHLDIEVRDLPDLRFNQDDINGAVVGGMVGYRVQGAASPWVLGVELNGLWTDINGKDSESLFGIPLLNLDTDSNVSTLVLAKAQVGVAYDRALFYLTGGYAGADVGVDAHLRFDGLLNEKIFEDSQWANGVVVGAGIDLAVTDNVVVGIEYNHIAFTDLNFADELDFGGGCVACRSLQSSDPSWKIKTDSNLAIDQIMGRVSFSF